MDYRRTFLLNIQALACMKAQMYRQSDVTHVLIQLEKDLWTLGLLLSLASLDFGKDGSG